MWNKVDLLLPDQPWQYPGGQAGDDHLEEDSGRDHPAPGTSPEALFFAPISEGDDPGMHSGADRGFVWHTTETDVLLARLEQEFELLTRGSAVQPARVLASVANGLGLEKLMDLVRIMNASFRPLLCILTWA